MPSLGQIVRYHPLIEWAQFIATRKPLLSIPFVDMKFNMEPGDVVIDRGANGGDVASRFSRSGATVYAFEPYALCFSILSRRFRALPSVRCFNKGVMDKRATPTLRTPKPHGRFDALATTVSASFVAQPIRFADELVETQEVECIDLHEFIHSLNKKVRVLKLDIEGSEIPVLNHLLDQRTFELVDFGIVETHERQMPELTQSTEEPRKRINSTEFAQRISLDWQ